MADGYQLRFSYKENFLGFKELLLEHLRGCISLTVTPGAGADGSYSSGVGTSSDFPKTVLLQTMLLIFRDRGGHERW